MFEKSLAMHDLGLSLKHPYLWALLGWYDIRQRYRRSVLGPLWLTMSTGILVCMLSVLWSTLFKIDIKDYLPFFAVGQVLWVFISGQLNESCTGFVQFEHVIKQIKLPFTSFILRLMTRNLIILLHNFLIVVIVISFVGPGWSSFAFLALPGLLITSCALFFLSIPVAIACTRYRDLQMIIQNLLMIAFYFTPIMWKANQLESSIQWVATLNPITPFIEIVRLPLLGQVPQGQSYIDALLAVLILAIIAFVTLSRFRQKISYWL